MRTFAQHSSQQARALFLLLLAFAVVLTVGLAATPSAQAAGGGRYSTVSLQAKAAVTFIGTDANGNTKRALVFPGGNAAGFARVNSVSSPFAAQLFCSGGTMGNYRILVPAGGTKNACSFNDRMNVIN